MFMKYSEMQYFCNRFLFYNYAVGAMDDDVDAIWISCQMFKLDQLRFIKHSTQVYKSNA